MGGDNFEWKIIGSFDTIKTRMVSKKNKKFVGLRSGYKLNIKELDVKDLEKKETKHCDDESKIDIKIIIRKNQF